MSGPRDERSVGELLLDSDFTARDILFDGPDLQAEPMLRTWGEVVQAAGELWDALPVPKGGAHGNDGEAYMMARLQEMNSSLHRSIRGKSWPGNGPADTRLSTIADNLTRAADLVRAAEPNRPNRHATRADLAAAKTRLMHTLYVACHGVGLAVGAHARELQSHFDAKGWISPTQSLAAVRSAQNRLAAFEQLTGAYVARSYPHALQGEYRLPPAPDRLAEALARWDVQAHRALSSQPTAANLMLLAQTQTMITGASQVLLQAGALAGRLPDYHSRLSPALDAAHAAWAATARAWTELTPPSQRRPTAEMSAAAAEARAALRELTHDRTGPASPAAIVARVDLGRVETTVGQSLATGVDLAHLMRDTLDSTPLHGAARAVNAVSMATDPASAGTDKDLGHDVAFVNPRDIADNRPVEIPALALGHYRANFETTIDAARDAMHAAAGLEHHRAAPEASPSTGRGHQDRTPPPPSFGADRPGPGCER